MENYHFLAEETLEEIVKALSKGIARKKKNRKGFEGSSSKGIADEISKYISEKFSKELTKNFKGVTE